MTPPGRQRQRVESLVVECDWSIVADRADCGEDARVTHTDDSDVMGGNMAALAEKHSLGVNLPTPYRKMKECEICVNYMKCIMNTV